MTRLVCSFTLAALVTASVFCAPPNVEAIAPRSTTSLFNGKDLSGFTTWLKETKRADPQRVFRVESGQIHVSGEGFGYLATEKSYRDYYVTVEYKWGKRTDGGKYVRNSGVLLNAVGPDGGANGAWMSCIECQLAQGCVGDLIVIRGKNEQGETIPVRITSDVAIGLDKKPRWKDGGEPQTFTNRQLWWNKHDPDFQELLDTRGKNDVESPLGEWTTVECVCAGSTITVFVNGTKVNTAYDVFPAAGKILLQVEGFELFVRKFEIGPARKQP
jgi:hypothetical protein